MIVDVIHRSTLRTRNKSNDYFESMRYRQDLFIITHYYKRKRFPSYTRCSENHNNTSAENRKIRSLKFDTLYWRHLVAYRNKKDGYRQQNVRQQQKLISIIDYDVCVTFY